MLATEFQKAICLDVCDEVGDVELKVLDRKLCGRIVSYSPTQKVFNKEYFYVEDFNSNTSHVELPGVLVTNFEISKLSKELSIELDEAGWIQMADNMLVNSDELKLFLCNKLAKSVITSLSYYNKNRNGVLRLINEYNGSKSFENSHVTVYTLFRYLDLFTESESYMLYLMGIPREVNYAREKKILESILADTLSDLLPESSKQSKIKIVAIDGDECEVLGNIDLDTLNKIRSLIHSTSYFE